MEMHRINKRVIDTVSFTLLQKYQLTAKFKVRLYYIQSDATKYYHSTYFKSPKSAIATLNSSQYIEISLRDDNGNNDYFIINELHRNRFIKKTIKLANALDAYDSGDVDILVNTQNGTRIHSEIAKEIDILLGTQKISITPEFDGTRISIAISYNDIKSRIYIQDFILLINKIKDINYSMMATNLIVFNQVSEDGDVINNQIPELDRNDSMPGAGGSRDTSSIWELKEPSEYNDIRKVKW